MPPMGRRRISRSLQPNWPPAGAELGTATMVGSERIASAASIVDSRLNSINAIADQVRQRTWQFRIGPECSDGAKQ